MGDAGQARSHLGKAVRNAQLLLDDVPASIQERAWTSANRPTPAGRRRDADALRRGPCRRRARG